MGKERTSFIFPLGFLLAWLLSLAIVHASEFQYFEKEIDYWNTKKEPAKAEEAPASLPKKSEASSTFDWKKHLDPKNPEFFKEGDYTPPHAFMEIARNPTDENLKMWFSYIDKKNQLTTRLQERMSEFLAKEGKALEPVAKESLQEQVRSVPKIPVEAKRYRFRLYFDSTCPHCQQMFGTLKILQEKGFYVEARQIDARTEGLENLPLPSTRATPEEIQKYKIQSVPYLLIGDLKNKVVYPMTGFQTPESIFDLLQNHAHDSKRERN